MLEFPAFPTSLLPIPKVTKEPTQTPTAKAEFAYLGTTGDKGETVPKEPENTTSLNNENKEEEKKHETAITTTATIEGKEPIPPTPPVSLTAQDRDVDHLIDKLTEIDKEGDDINPMKRKLRYKINAHKSTRRAK
ncbi:hypothetical protein J1N35_011275 [Gossypium stocksii]|uniref:Uncharacterized protein n=1 Tax=Gossypium stocksii TaxID=47602 RepID=A0A9D3W397_9ROSI|nr:hypothetical protein J1N35_011275 [Gossypium stocksii]